MALGKAIWLMAAASGGPEPIVVTAERPASRVLPPVVELTEGALEDRQPRNVSDAIAELPGVSVRVNSRGEAIARVRGSDERQTQVFLDGAPLAVPWDGRADIGVIPAGLIETVRATKGATPIEYGTNAVAGAIDLLTRSGGGLRATAGAGSHGFAEASAVAGMESGPFGITAAGAFLSRDAEPVADLDALPFSQPREDGRLNTDLDSFSLFGAARYSGAAVDLRASLLHVDAERGIAPESDRDPAVNAPRYWRYPTFRQTQFTMGGSAQLSRAATLRMVGWRQWFEQVIEQYRDQGFAEVRAREEDADDTWGARAVLTGTAGPLTARLMGSAQTSRHAQVDTALPAAPGPELVYRQNLFMLGSEADIPLGPGRSTFGLAYDHSANPRTGDKPAYPQRGALAFSAAYRLPFGKGWTLIASGGRRNRFPSARELFGEALGRFLPNPELKPEQAWLADLDLSFAGPRMQAQLNPFIARNRDSIAQRVVRVDGRNLRQRYNLSGSWSVGVDAVFFANLGGGVSAELQGSVLHARADAGTSAVRRLPQRPSYEASAALGWRPVDPISLRVEVRRVGPAVDLAPDGSKARLAPGNEISLRGSWRLATLRSGKRVALTASAENVADEVITPQLGLPLPGRSFRVGLRMD